MVYGYRHISRRGSYYDEELDPGKKGYYFKDGAMYIPEGSHKENMRKYERDHVEYHQRRMNRSDYGSDDYKHHKKELERHKKSLERQEGEYRDAKRKGIVRERPRKPVDYENPIDKREKEEERNEKKRNQEKREFKNPLLEKEESEDTVEQSTKKPPSPPTNEEKQIINNSDNNKDIQQNPENRLRKLSDEAPSPQKSDTRVGAKSEESFSMFKQTQEGVDDTDNPMFSGISDLTNDSELTKGTSDLKTAKTADKVFGDLDEL